MRKAVDGSGQSEFQVLLHDTLKPVIPLRIFLGDEENQCGVGDSVRIIESRPMSKRKRWRIQKIVSKAL